MGLSSKSFLQQSVAATALFIAFPAVAHASDANTEALIQRLDRLEQANARLEAEVTRLRGQDAPAAVAPAPSGYASAAQPHWTTDKGEPQPRQASWSDAEGPKNVVGFKLDYAFEMLDHAEGVNKRQIMLLKARRDNRLNSRVTISGAVTAIANAHFSNRPNKFGYLMRHPTGNNQRTKKTQEVTVASAQLAFTVTPTEDISAYAELLYDPEQSFGAGTLTALTRNQVQVRKAYVMWGNLKKSPVYIAAGKMDVPFGLQDTVSPYTNSTNWHAFAPLAFGGQVGYYDENLSVRAMMIQGGAQFRGANTPVDGTAIPSKLNNFAVDANYTYHFNDDAQLMAGGSYIHGSAYCQGYPVVHFNPCSDNVPAWSAYGQLDVGGLRLLGEFTRTTKVWPGTQVPTPTNPLAQFAASKVTALTAGGRYTLPISRKDTSFSVEYSRFLAGPDGSPWHRQNQIVAGISRRLGTSVDLFGEFTRVDGFAPLNFVSGGNQPNGGTWSDASAESHVIMLGVQAAF